MGGWGEGGRAGGVEAGTLEDESCGREGPLRTAACFAIHQQMQTTQAAGHHSLRFGSMREVPRKRHTQMGDNQPMKRAGVKQHREGAYPIKKLFFS